MSYKKKSPFTSCEFFFFHSHVRDCGCHIVVNLPAVTWDLFQRMKVLTTSTHHDVASGSKYEIRLMFCSICTVSNKITVHLFLEVMTSSHLKAAGSLMVNLLGFVLNFSGEQPNPLIFMSSK